MSYIGRILGVHLLAVFAILLVLVPRTASAVWDGNPYTPGSTLTPECAPTDVDCTVSPMPITLGGTGTSTPAAFGNVLSWNGTNWQGVSTSTLGLGTGTFLELSDTISSYTANRILFETANGVTDSASLTFDGATLAAPIFSASNANATSTFAGGLNVDSGGLIYDRQTGRVGIGLSAPLAQLDVNSANSSGLLTLSFNGSTRFAYSTPDGGSGALFQMYASNGTSQTVRFEGRTELPSFIDLGNFGIGDQGPDAHFEVSASGDAADLFFLSSDDGGDGDLFTVKNSGLVGIGTSTPSAKFAVNGDTFLNGALTVLGDLSLGNFNEDATFTCGNQYHTFIGPVGTVGGDECAALNVTQEDVNGNVIYRFGGVNAAWAGEFYSNDALVGMNTKGGLPLHFQINGDNKMVVLSNDNVGIGTTAPDDLLHVVKSSSVDPTTLKIQNQFGSIGAAAEILLSTSDTLTTTTVGAAVQALRTGGGGDTDLIFKTSANTTLNENMRILANGNVGIGTSSPASFKLQVAGDIGPDKNTLYNLGSTALRWGCIWTSDGSTGTCASDERLKENIEILDFGNALEKVAGLRMHTFSYKEDPAHNETLGLVAQEVEEVAPELVVTDEETDMKLVRYGALQWLVLDALQELIAKVADMAEDFVTGTLTARDKLCVGETCVDEAELQELLEGADISHRAEADESNENDDAPELLPAQASSTVELVEVDEGEAIQKNTADEKNENAQSDESDGVDETEAGDSGNAQKNESEEVAHEQVPPENTEIDEADKETAGEPEEVTEPQVSPDPDETGEETADDASNEDQSTQN